MTEERMKTDQTVAPKAGGRHSAKPGAAPAAAKAQGAHSAQGKKSARGEKSAQGGKSGAKSKAKSKAKPRKRAESPIDRIRAAIGERAGAPRQAGSGAKSGQKKRRKGRGVLHSTFYRVYFVVVLLCVVGIIVGANYLRGLLADYESAQPEHVAETAMQMFEDKDFDTIYSYDTSAANIDGGKAFYIDSMREIAQGKDVSWKESYASSQDEMIYDVLLSNEKFAEVSLVPSGEVTKHGFTLWKLGSVTTNVTMGEQEEPEVEEEPVEEEEEEVPTGIPCHVTVPSDSTVTVNGVALTQEDVSSADIPAVSPDLLPAGVPNPTLTEYLFYSETNAPQISVTDKNGNPQELKVNGDYKWSCSLPESPELKEQFEKPVVEIAKDIARVAAKTATKDAVLRYCAKDSPARASINKFDNSTGYSKKPESFENIVSSDYHQYAENCFSCHVSFDYLSRFTAEVTKTYPTTLTLYFIMQDGNGKLYSFTLY